MKLENDYHIVTKGHFLPLDQLIAYEIGMSVKDYQQQLLKLGGHCDIRINEVYFDNKDIAKKALEWIESRYIIFKLNDER